MRVFVTGGSGFIGSAVVRELVAHGHAVTGLARSERAAEALRRDGGSVLRGGLDDLPGLRRGAEAAEGVIHLAFIHSPGQASTREKLRIFLGGAPGGIAARFGAVITGADRRAIDALASPLAQTGRPLVAAFPTMSLAAGRLATETDAIDPRAPGAMRGENEAVMDGWAARGVRTGIVRLPPSVHGDGKAGFVTRLVELARKKRVAGQIGDGGNHWPAVHVLDAARLFRLALENGEAGARHHAVADEGVPVREINGVIARRLGVPARPLVGRDAARYFGWMGMFVEHDNRVSSALTRGRLGWEPTEVGLLEDLDRAVYFPG